MRTLIFLDDERNLEDVSWIEYDLYCDVKTVRNFNDFKKVVSKTILTNDDLLNFDFSFDHDLADYSEKWERTGYDCAIWLINFIIEKDLDPNYLFWHIHSKNPVGKENIDNYLQSYVHFFNNYGNPALGI